MPSEIGRKRLFGQKKKLEDADRPRANITRSESNASASDHELKDVVQESARDWCRRTTNIGKPETCPGAPVGTEQVESRRTSVKTFGALAGFVRGTYSTTLVRNVN